MRRNPEKKENDRKNVAKREREKNRKRQKCEECEKAKSRESVMISEGELTTREPRKRKKKTKKTESAIMIKRGTRE